MTWSPGAPRRRSLVTAHAMRCCPMPNPRAAPSTLMCRWAGYRSRRSPRTAKYVSSPSARSRRGSRSLATMYPSGVPRAPTATHARSGNVSTKCPSQSVRNSARSAALANDWRLLASKKMRSTASSIPGVSMTSAQGRIWMSPGVTGPASGLAKRLWVVVRVRAWADEVNQNRGHVNERSA